MTLWLRTVRSAKAPVKVSPAERRKRLRKVRYAISQPALLRMPLREAGLCLFLQAIIRNIWCDWPGEAPRILQAY